MRKKSTLDWAEKHVRLDYGRFDRQRHRLLIEPLETIDRRVGCTFLLQGSIQSVKTLTATLWAQASFQLRPGRTGWYSKSADAVGEFSDEKFMPLFEDIRPLQPLLSANPHKKTRLGILFPHAPFRLLSAGVQLARNSKTLENIVCDEAWTYEPGELTEIRGRYTDYQQTYRLILPSSGPTKGSEVDQIWEESDKRTWHSICPCCKNPLPLEFFPPEPAETIGPDGKKVEVRPAGGLRFATGEEVWKDDGRLDWDLFGASVRLQCPHCADEMPWSGRLANELDQTGHYIPLATGGRRDVVAWNWNALAHMDWRVVAELWMKAVRSLHRGDPTAMEDFWRKRLGRAWDPRQLHKKDASARREEMGEYALGDPIPEGWLTWMTVDVQQDHFWAVVRAWCPGPVPMTRTIAAERLLSAGAVRELQERFGIKGHGGLLQINEDGAYELPQGCGVWIDGNYNPSYVRRLASTYQWGVLRGSDVAQFRHRDGFYRIYDEIRAIDAWEGTLSQGDRYVPEVRFANDPARNLFELLRSISDPQRIWTYAKDVPAAYREHISAWTRQSKRRKKDDAVIWEWRQVADRDDLWWCEKAQVVVGSMAGIVGGAPEVDPAAAAEVETASA
jgi:hypothetical protein